eukprot:scaffold8631_cov108-Isochrysis_galbana.AAC.18
MGRAAARELIKGTRGDGAACGGCRRSGAVAAMNARARAFGHAARRRRPVMAGDGRIACAHSSNGNGLHGLLLHAAGNEQACNSGMAVSQSLDGSPVPGVRRRCTWSLLHWLA